MSTRLPRRLAATAAVVALASTVAGCGSDDGTDTGTGTEATSPSTAPRPSDTTSSAVGSPSAVGSSSAAPTGAPATTVYYVGRSPQGPRLFAEARTSAEPDHGEALELGLLTAAPDDPDYRTLWPSGAFTGGGLVDGQIDVYVDAGYDRRPNGMSGREAKLAIQQVVYTLQAAAQQPLPVRFRSGDAPAASVLGIDQPAAGFAAADQVAVLGLVNVLSPTEGQTVSGSFTASGFASSFEGSVPWRILDSSGKKVLQGSGQGTMDFTRLTPWQAAVDVSSLPPGDYTFVAMTDDPTGGTEGPGPTSDTKTITIS